MAGSCSGWISEPPPTETSRRHYVMGGEEKQLSSPFKAGMGECMAVCTAQATTQPQCTAEQTAGHTPTHTPIPTQTHDIQCTHTHTHAHTHARTHIHTRTHTTHMHTHTYCSPKSSRGGSKVSGCGTKTGEKTLPSLNGRNLASSPQHSTPPRAGPCLHQKQAQ